MRLGSRPGHASWMHLRPSGEAYAVAMEDPIGFEGLDFLYTPSRDVAADMADFVDVLGGRLVFAIDDGGIRVAMIELTDGPPRILLTDHVEGERPILVYRVTDHARAVAGLKRRGSAGNLDPRRLSGDGVGDQRPSLPREVARLRLGQPQRGLVKRREEGPEGIRLHCDVWIENQAGEKVIVGTASGLVS